MIYVDVSTVGRTLEGLSCSTNTPGFTSPRSAYWFCFRKPITKFSALECNMTTGYWVQFAVIKLTCCSIPYYLGTYCFLSLTQNRCSIFLHRRPMISHETDLIRLHSLWGLRLVKQRLYKSSIQPALRPPRLSWRVRKVRPVKSPPVIVGNMMSPKYYSCRSGTLLSFR